MKHIPLAGRDITNFFRGAMKERKEPVQVEDQQEAARMIKERFGYCCADMAKEFVKFDTKVQNGDGSWSQSKKFKTFEGKSASTGKRYKCDVGYEQFLGPEMFFHPEFFSSDWRDPIDKLVDDSIQKCPIDTRTRLYNRIILSGGSTMFNNFDKRLKQEVQRRVAERSKNYEKLTGNKVLLFVLFKIC